VRGGVIFAIKHVGAFATRKNEYNVLFVAKP